MKIFSSFSPFAAARRVGRSAYKGTLAADSRRTDRGAADYEPPLRRLLETTSDRIALVGRDGTLLYLNRAAPGAGVDEVIGAPVYASMPTKAAGVYRQALERAFEKGEASAAEIVDALGRTLECRFVPLSSDGLGDAMMVVASDVTEDRRLEETLRRRTAELDDRTRQLRCLLDLSRIFGEDGHTLEEIFEQTVAAVPSGWRYPGIACASLTFGGRQFTTPNFRETPWRQSGEIVVDGVAEGTVEVFYLEECPPEDEGPFLKEERDVIDEVASRLARFVKRRREEEGLRQSEARFRAVVDHAPADIHLKDLEGRYLLVNRRFEERSGLERGGAAGKTAYDLFPGHLADTYAAHEEAVVETFAAVEREVCIPNPDGTTRTYLSVKFPVIGPGGEPVGIGGVDTDITERTQAERRLRLRNQELSLLHRISEVFLDARSLRAAFRHIAEAIGQDTSFPIVSIELYDQSRDAMLDKGTKGLPPPAGTGRPSVPADETFSGFVVRSGQPVVETRVGRKSRYAKAPGRQKMETVVCVPMALGENVIGALTLGHPDHIDLDDHVAELAATLANHIAALTERMTTEDTLRRQARRLFEVKKRVGKAGPVILEDRELVELLLLRTVAPTELSELSQRLVNRFGSFASIITADPKVIGDLSGGGEAALGFAAIREAAIRLAREEILDRPILKSADKVIAYCRVSMAHNNIEGFLILYLNRKNVLIADVLQQEGTVGSASIYPREVFKQALELGATAMIMVHNHPSDDPTPTEADIAITREIKEAGERLGITLHDHVIVSKSGHSSFKALGLL